MSELLDSSRHLLEIARSRAGDHPVARDLEAAQHRLLDPLRVAVAGRVKAGKSTLVNSMIGELVAPTDARECTRVVTWYRDGVTYRVEGVGADGARSQLRFDRDERGLTIDLGGQSADDLMSIDVTWPSSRLREMTLVDTPGVDSLSVDVAARTERFLHGDSDRPTPTDAVLYLLRHVHASDVAFLEAFHDQDLAAANPVNSIGVLSRADEIGAARPDALASAARIADRWRADRRLMTLVQTVVPVAGLLAETASTLRQTEFDSFAALARADTAEVDALLVSADRFGAVTAPVGVTDIERRMLLDRLGLFGCRLAVDLTRSGRSTTATALAAELLAASGLPALRAELNERFMRRSELLKARNAMLAVGVAATALGDAHLATEVERVLDSAHEFAELRVLNAMRRGQLSFDDRRTASARSLLGDGGMTAARRAGLDEGADVTEVRAALADQLSMWQAQAEHPLATPDLAAAARVLTRTCEGLIAATMTA